MSNSLDSEYPGDVLDLHQMNRVLRHRLRNLCAGVKMTASRMADQTRESNPRMSSRCDVIVSELDNLNEFTQRMDLLFDTLPPPEPKNLFELITDLREFFVKTYPFCTLNFDGAEENINFTSGSLIFIALMELIDNAGEAAGDNGTVDLAWSENDNNYTFSITNTGCSIPQDIPINPPEPFNTLRSRHDGIGMSIAHRICKALNSELFINISSQETVIATVQLSAKEFTHG